MVIFDSYVSLPEGIAIVTLRTEWRIMLAQQRVANYRRAKQQIILSIRFGF